MTYTAFDLIAFVIYAIFLISLNNKQWNKYKIENHRVPFAIASTIEIATMFYVMYGVVSLQGVIAGLLTVAGTALALCVLQRIFIELCKPGPTEVESSTRHMTLVENEIKVTEHHRTAASTKARSNRLIRAMINILRDYQRYEYPNQTAILSDDEFRGRTVFLYDGVTTITIDTIHVNGEEVRINGDTNLRSLYPEALEWLSDIVHDNYCILNSLGKIHVPEIENNTISYDQDWSKIKF